MTIILELQPDKQRRLEALATEAGKDVTGFLTDVINRLVGDAGAGDAAVKGKSFDELLAPFRRGFADTEGGEEEAGAFLDAELEAVRAERHAKREANGR